MVTLFLPLPRLPLPLVADVLRQNLEGLLQHISVADFALELGAADLHLGALEEGNVALERRTGDIALALVRDLAHEPQVHLRRKHRLQLLLDLHPALLGRDVPEHGHDAAVVGVVVVFLELLGLGLQFRQRGVGRPPHEDAAVLQLELRACQGRDDVLLVGSHGLHLVAAQDEAHLQPALGITCDLLGEELVGPKVLVAHVVLHLLPDDGGVRRASGGLQPLGLWLGLRRCGRHGVRGRLLALVRISHRHSCGGSDGPKACPTHKARGGKERRRGCLA
mmetsp:Transcript_69816/g.200103  ORF Transcript_69816/g.200103 Transcript_69816/m.200103 type:complete len:278 (+) Transcript_69816:671-1504(+)